MRSMIPCAVVRTQMAVPGAGKHASCRWAMAVSRCAIGLNIERPWCTSNQISAPAALLP